MRAAGCRIRTTIWTMIQMMTGNIAYETLDDGKIRYIDYDNNVSITYPDWMSCMEDVNPGTVTITDGDGGYVVGQNITEMYWGYSGSDRGKVAGLYERTSYGIF